jgi:hypothetical protein
LREETGLVAKKLIYVGHQYLAYGYSNQGYHIYIATDFEQRTTSLDAEEEGLVSKKFTLAAFEEMIKSGIIKDASTVNAYNLAKMKGFIN